jgi:hypothetical protein
MHCRVDFLASGEGDLVSISKRVGMSSVHCPKDISISAIAAII